MIALVELVDEFGEAIEADFAAVYGESLRDYLMARRPAGEALRKIDMLPPGCATRAQMQAKPSSGRPNPPEPWRLLHGVTPTVDALWDVWDAVVATAQGSKGKPPTHPRAKPPASSRGRPNAARTTT